jgi:hypothetical protein
MRIGAHARSVFVPISLSHAPVPVWQSGTPMDQAKAMPPLDLTDENVAKALEEAKNMLGTIFGNSAENRNIGITGDVQVCLLWQYVH